MSTLCQQEPHAPLASPEIISNSPLGLSPSSTASRVDSDKENMDDVFARRPESLKTESPRSPRVLEERQTDAEVAPPSDEHEVTTGNTSSDRYASECLTNLTVSHLSSRGHNSFTPFLLIPSFDLVLCIMLFLRFHFESFYFSVSVAFMPNNLQRDLWSKMCHCLIFFRFMFTVNWQITFARLTIKTLV